MERDSQIIYRSFYKQAGRLPDDERLLFYDALMAFMFDDYAEDTGNYTVDAIMDGVKPQVMANNNRRDNGNKGGRPRKETEKPMVTENTETKKPMVTKKEKTEKPMVIENAETEKPMVTENTENSKPNWELGIGNVNWELGIGNEKGDCKGEETSPSSPTPPKPKKPKKEEPIKFPSGEFMNVMLTAEEQSKLVERYGHKATDEYVNKLSGYMRSKGTKYKDHYATILNWMRNDHVPQMDAPIKTGSDLLDRAAKMLGGTA